MLAHRNKNSIFNSKKMINNDEIEKIRSQKYELEQNTRKY